MALVTVQRYRAITGDSTTTETLASARIEEATEILEERLDRPLASAERTERMWPLRDGSFLPHAIPVTVCADYTIDGDRLLGAVPVWTGFLETIPDGTDVTYTGGWVERSANPDADNALPVCIERDIAWAAWALGQTTAAQAAASVPAGVSSRTLGDASESYREGTTIAPGEANIVWSRRTLGYRYSRVSGYR